MTATAPVEEPYVGLGHFTEAYADRFFGRDTECSLIIGNLRAARLTLLYAESGVGKSSVLRAGVLARLHGFAERDMQARGAPRLVPVVFSSWSGASVAGLVRAIGAAIAPYLGDRTAPELPEDDLEAALAGAGAALEATLLVILDQFEEYFLYPDEQPEEKRVAAQIARCVNRSDLRANFLISIREDSYARLGDLFRGKVGNVYANFLHLDFLDRPGARESIEKPIERINELGRNGDRYGVEPALVDAVLDQVGRGQIDAADEDGHRGAGNGHDEIETTYLQLVMRRLWEEETEAGSPLLRLRTLEGLGGSQAVITSHLDRAMDDESDGAGLSSAQRLVAASVFHFLVTSGGTKIALTAKDLADLSGHPVAEIEPVLQHLASSRLHILRPVVSEGGDGAPRYEIFHDALARPIVEWRRRVEEAELDKRLVRERAEKEKAQQAAAAAERREARERKRKRWALIVLGAVVGFLVIGAFLALIEQEKLAGQRKDAEQSVRAAERIGELARTPSVFPPAAVALAGVAAHELSPTAEARNASLSQLQLNPGMPAVLTGHARAVNSVAYWPGSDNLVSGGEEGTVRFWSAQGRPLGDPQADILESINAVAVSRLPGGTWLVAASQQGIGGSSEYGTLVIWQVDRNGQVLNDGLETFSGEMAGLAFDPRDPTLLAASTGRVVSLWDAGNINNLKRRDRMRMPGAVRDLAFAPGGDALYAATARDGERIRVAGKRFTGGPVELAPRPTDAVAVAASGSYAFGGPSGINLRDAARRRSSHLAAAGDIRSLAFARDGSILVSGGEDRNVVTWDVASGRPFGPPRATEHSAVRDVAVSPDGDDVAAATGESLIKVWPLEVERPLAMTVGGQSVAETGGEFGGAFAMAVGAGGRVAVANFSDAAIWRVRPLADNAGVPRPLARIPHESEAVAYDGNLLALGTGRSFRLAETGPACARLGVEPCHWVAPPPSYSPTLTGGLALRRSGSRVLLASAGQRSPIDTSLVTIWDVTDAVKTGRMVRLASLPLAGTLASVAFSRDGSRLVASTFEGEIRVWDLSDPRHPEGTPILDAAGVEDKPVWSVAFSPDGGLLATAGEDQEVRLWKVSGRPGQRPTVRPTAGNLFQSETIRAVAFSPDGGVLAVGDDSGRICLYEVGTRTAIGGTGCLVAHATHQDGWITALAFARLGGETVLLSAGQMQPIVAWSSDLWNLSDSDQADRRISADVCRLARRNLSKDEWEEAFAATDLADDRHPVCLH